MKTDAHSLESPSIKDRTETVVEVKNLSKSFGGNFVLKNFNFQLKKGENVVVLGKSGSGKSVFIKCLIGLMKPDSGSIQLFGQPIDTLDADGLDQLRAKIGFLFQSNALYDSMTVKENLEFPLRRHGAEKTKEESHQLIMDALSNVGLADTADMMPSELSGGMKKRIALARTLILKPEIILYDEPTTGLDPLTGREISNLIIAIQKKYATSSIIISHDMNCVKIVADRIVMLIDGRCYASGTYEELKNSSDKKISQFFE